MSDRQVPPGWAKGTSGNPAGRPKGSGEVARVRAAIAEHVPAVIAKLVDSALAGDIGAARLLLERTIAPLKASEEKTEMTLPDGSLTDQGRAVIAAIASGDLAPGQGAALLASLGTLAKLTEADELEQRIKALEERHAVKP
ncbi:MAG: hypothetical protein JNM97_22330 [Rhodoferax sp.]|nr:hypothetical protein [Rhodoferax sp.]